MKADQILVIDGGQIVERGTHGELLELGGKYSEMWTGELRTTSTHESHNPVQSLEQVSELASRITGNEEFDTKAATSQAQLVPTGGHHTLLHVEVLDRDRGEPPMRFQNAFLASPQFESATGIMHCAGGKSAAVIPDTDQTIPVTILENKTLDFVNKNKGSKALPEPYVKTDSTLKPDAKEFVPTFLQNSYIIQSSVRSSTESPAYFPQAKDSGSRLPAHTEKLIDVEEPGQPVNPSENTMNSSQIPEHSIDADTDQKQKRRRYRRKDKANNMNRTNDGYPSSAKNSSSHLTQQETDQRNLQRSSIKSVQSPHVLPPQIFRPVEHTNVQTENPNLSRTQGLLNIYNAAAARRYPMKKDRQFPDSSTSTQAPNSFIPPNTESRGASLPGRKTKDRYRPTYATTSYGTMGTNNP